VRALAGDSTMTSDLPPEDVFFLAIAVSFQSGFPV
jgi:hypothetical protein